jgi:hypothetical protein
MFIVRATVVTIVNYDRNMFIVQAMSCLVNDRGKSFYNFDARR